MQDAIQIESRGPIAYLSIDIFKAGVVCTQLLS